ncbi:hypothetical protein EOD39_1512 [Acipenser ruthenus]|uniref:DDE Tnp4 domain-containing protein n=1 Tax=Acipenser ruthenus TaxID=7906 RepID=A0A444UAS6_ACIRT|nr:hypothetical protein EOD39_1512 [Acipenser ruthenus]
MAVVDADLNFIYVDVGTNGRMSDGCVWGKCGFSSTLANNTLYIPDVQALAGRETKVPYVLIADEAFGLKPYLMKPFPRGQLNLESQIFNYRLSRARRCIENAFGILAARWRVFRKAIGLQKIIRLAACTLHNFQRSTPAARNVCSPPGSIDIDDLGTGQVIAGAWRNKTVVQPMSSLGGNRCNHADKNFFISPAALLAGS